jgi:general secretion pathway protein C
MSQNSKKSAIGVAVALLLSLFIAKAFWVYMEAKYLPKETQELQKSSGIKKLYYHYNLASKKDKPKPIVKKESKQAVKIKKPNKPKEPEKITKFALKGVYNSSDKKIIIVEYRGKSYSLQTGEELEGYKFVNLFATYALFKKDGKEYKLDLYKKSANNSTNSTTKPSSFTAPKEPAKVAKKETKEEPTQDGATTVIPKSLFNKYKGDYRAIRRNINAVPNMENGKLSGFKISFVRPGSDFSKLGLKRGDIIKAINGEALDNFKVPLELFNNADTLSAATFTIKRGNEIKELEYEVR